jgi:hypothetical protein
VGTTGRINGYETETVRAAIGDYFPTFSRQRAGRRVAMPITNFRRAPWMI